jgi:RNA polymerase sigma-70 factor (ECF subfamily)
LEEAWLTRKTLIMRARDKSDEHAWDDFVNYYKDFIQMVLAKMGLSGSECDDLTQETLISLWEKLPELNYNKEKAKFRTWLSRVIKNKAIDYFRKISTQNKLKQNYSKEQEAQLESDETDEMIQQEWEIHLIKLALNRISSRFSENSLKTFELAMEGLDDHEIAKKLNQQPNTINKLKNRIKKRLIQEVESLTQELETC